MLDFSNDGKNFRGPNLPVCRQKTKRARMAGHKTDAGGGPVDSGLSSQVTIRNLSLVNMKNTVIDGSTVAIDEINTTFDQNAIVKMRSLRGAIEINAAP